MRTLLLTLAQLDPTAALHDAWKAQNPEIHVASGGAGFAAWLSGLNWAAIASFIAVAVPLAFGVLMQCYKQIAFARIEIKERQLAAEDRIAARRASTALPTGQPVVAADPA